MDIFRQLTKFLFASLQVFLGLLALGDVNMLDQNLRNPIAQESCNPAYKPSLFMRGMAWILGRILFPFLTQNGPDTSGELRCLAGIGADRAVAHRQIVDSF